MRFCYFFQSDALSGKVNISDIVDNLTSTDTDKPLSANQGTVLKTSVSNGKTLVASAITDKGVETASDATFATMASNIESLKTVSRNILIGSSSVSSNSNSMTIQGISSLPKLFIMYATDASSWPYSTGIIKMVFYSDLLSYDSYNHGAFTTNKYNDTEFSMLDYGGLSFTISSNSLVISKYSNTSQTYYGGYYFWFNGPYTYMALMD